MSKCYFRDPEMRAWEQEVKDELGIDDTEWIFRVAAYEYKHTGQLHSLPSKDWLTRPLVITPFDGHYGQAGVVIAINGSPSKFLALVEAHKDIVNPDSIIYHFRTHKVKMESFQLYSWGDQKGTKAELARAILALLRDRGFVSK